VSLGQGIEVDQLAQVLLAHTIVHFGAAGVELPEHRVVTAGAPAWDCEQLTVTLVGVGWGQAPDSATESARPGSPVSVYAVRHALYAVSLVRCVPVPDEQGAAPTMAELNAAGLRFMRDAGLLSQALVEVGSGLRNQLGPAGSVQAGMIEPIGPEGGFVGMDGQFIVTSATLG
jgi:hypothetical protein